ncbi:MAG: prolyl oligopeptidase family serine peptidase, partial [Gammaproteobacteria bacterium]|nr:prolyl oligopeptidase family serine peptidase [Gammaproteobacteria bacterium]
FVGPIPFEIRGDPPGTNVPLAKHLQGKLLIIHGTADRFVPIGHTMRLVKAFIEAGKPIDLLIMPDEPHGSPGIFGYGRDAMLRYFCEHLSTDVELTTLTQRRLPPLP